MFLTNKANIVGALEDTPYTPDTLLDADFDIEPENLSYSPEVNEFQRKVLDGTLDTYNSVMGKQACNCSFMTPMNPGAAAATEPKWGKFLEACGFKKTAHGSTGISWVPHVEKTHNPMTIEVIEIADGASPSQIVTRIGGAMGNVTFQIGEVGEPIQMNFEFQGRLVSIADRAYGSILTQSGLSTVQPPAVLAATIQVASVTQNMETFELNTGNTLNRWTDASKSSGIKGAYVSGRESTISLDPTYELLATEAVYTQWIAGTTGALSIVIGSTPQLTISAPVSQYSTVGMGEREGARVAEKVLRLHGSSGNDSFEILQGAKA